MTLVLLIFTLCIPFNNAILVKVQQGLLKGEVVANEVDGSKIYSFKGVPYAQPPVGHLRFKAPRPVSSWKGVKDAKKHGAVCPQFDFLTGEIIPGNENCLFLNIYTPNLNCNASLAVMFFIHGGGYVSGSGNDDFYGPDFIVRKDVILVTINYRLGALGFLKLDITEVPGNAGMRDQVMALKWVNENIRSFGGDPNKITIIGQSAGAAAVMYHLASPLTKGLFSRAIAVSGTPTCDFNFSYELTRRSYILTKILGKETSNPHTALQFLQSVDAVRLLRPPVFFLSTEAVSANNRLRFYYFKPDVEKNFGTIPYLEKKYLDSVKDGDLHNVDLFFGTTNLETIYTITKINNTLRELNTYPESFVPVEILDQVTPAVSLKISDLLRRYYFGNKSLTIEHIKEYLIYSSETYTTGAVRRFADLVSKKLSNVYLYKFASFSKRNYYGRLAVPYGIYAASHIDDLLYIMYPKSLNLTADINSIEFKMVELTTNVFTNFVKYGTPTPDNSLGLIWPTYNTTNKNYVTISNVTLRCGRNPDSSATILRNSIFKKLGIDY